MCSQICGQMASFVQKIYLKKKYKKSENTKKLKKKN